MAKKDGKPTAKEVRELYLYPYRSKEENIVRGIVWMASWLVGIVVQPTANQQALGGAYLIFSISLLLEFVPEQRRYSIARIIHGLFCVFLVFILSGSLLMIFGGLADTNTKLKWQYRFLLNAPLRIGWIVFIMIFLSLFLSMVEAHTYLYDEEARLQQDIEAKQEMERKRFMDHLNGTSDGGNKQ